jgi:AraC-like DNA-binding protein
LNQQRHLSDEQFIAVELAWSLFAKAVIEIRLRDPDLTPELIAQECGLSRRTLYRLFESEGGVAGYIWERRLSAACRELRAPELSALSVGEIAARAGFKRFSHFSYLFKKTFLITPREYRLNNLSATSKSKHDDILGANNEAPTSSPAFDSVVRNYRAKLNKNARYKLYESPLAIKKPQSDGGSNAISIAFCSLAFLK